MRERRLPLPSTAFSKYWVLIAAPVLGPPVNLSSSTANSSRHLSPITHGLECANMHLYSATARCNTSTATVPGHSVGLGTTKRADSRAKRKAWVGESRVCEFSQSSGRLGGATTGNPIAAERYQGKPCTVLLTARLLTRYTVARSRAQRAGIASSREPSSRLQACQSSARSIQYVLGLLTCPHLS